MASSDLRLPVFTSWCNNFPLFLTMSWLALLLINNTQHKWWDATSEIWSPKKCGFPVSNSLCLLALRKASCHMVRCPMPKPTGEGTDKGLWPTATKDQDLNHTPRGNWYPTIPKQVNSRDLSGKMTLLVNTLTAASWQTPGQRHPSYAVPRVLTHRRFEIKNVFCFTLLNFEAIGYTALLHSNGQLI